MKNYIWLNPVVRSSYPASHLSLFFQKNQLIEVFPKEDHLAIVKKEYQQLLAASKEIVVDQRCPLMPAFFKNKEGFLLHKIEPILIHVARELAQREDLRDGKKWIICPCRSLVEMGNRLFLENTFFLTWDDWVKRYHFNEEGTALSESPIPFGFFHDIEKRVVYRSCDNLEEDIPEGTRLVEGLYCHGGCHRGDGVRCITANKKPG